MLSKPLISVIFPENNAEVFIQQAIDSACTQSYENVEVQVGDDGSHDRTAEIVQAITLGDCRVKLIQQAHYQIATARLLLLRHKAVALMLTTENAFWFSQKWLAWIMVGFIADLLGASLTMRSLRECIFQLPYIVIKQCTLFYPPSRTHSLNQR